MLKWCFRSGFIIITAAMLNSCGWFSDESKNYVEAKTVPPLTVPKQLSSSKVKDTYPIPRGNLWQPNEPVNIYPPGSNLAKQAEAGEVKEADAHYQMGVGPDGEAALLVLEPFANIWKKLPDALTKRNEYRMISATENKKLIIFQTDDQQYRLNVIPYTQNKTVLILQTIDGGFVPEDDAQELLDQIHYGLSNAGK